MKKLQSRVVSDPFGALVNWTEKVGVVDPCSWFGVDCANGNVMALNLKNLRLGGTIAPDLQNLVHLKSIILRNNSFLGIIPKEIRELKKLEVLDLGHNRLSGALPSDLNCNLQLSVLLIDNNEFTVSMPSEIDEIKLLSEVQRNGKFLSSRRLASWFVNRDIALSIGRQFGHDRIVVPMASIITLPSINVSIFHLWFACTVLQFITS